MKTKLLFIGTLFFSALFSFSALAEVDTVCSHQGAWFELVTTADMKHADYSYINSSNVVVAKGTLDCQGPQQNSYTCSGVVTELGGQTYDISMMIPEQTLQNNGNGTIQLHGADYDCRQATKY